MEPRAHDKWILGISESGRRYLIHTAVPRFTCEIFAADDDRGVLDRLSFALSDERSMANFVFIDDAPGTRDLHSLLNDADRFLRRMSAIGE